MNAPGVDVAMFGSGQQIAVGRPGVDTGEHGLGTLKDYVVQANADWRQVDAAVDGACLPRRRLMNVVDSALADAHAQQVAHQCHDAAVRAVSDQGNGQLKQYCVIRCTRKENLGQGGAGFVRLLVDELAADVVSGGQVGDRCRPRQRLNGHTNSIGIRQPGCRASGWIHV